MGGAKCVAGHVTCNLYWKVDAVLLASARVSRNNENAREKSTAIKS
jgi:hypothetical protein